MRSRADTRRLASLAQGGPARVAVLILVLVCPCQVRAQSPTATPPGQPTAEQIARAIEKVRADPNLATERTIKTLRWKGSDTAANTTRMPQWLLRVTEVVGNGAAAAVFLLIAWIYGASALDNYASGARVMNAVQWPSWIPEAIVVLGAFTISLRLLGRTIGHATSLVSGRSVIELPSSVEA